uniref:Uncharacterized protein n=1 Tax=Tanacetum cinerariifolium TaxID=118510 RepID=A0A699RBV6_TANCI|nr:hypothetical protein [Tanacetum cinerariifolium]
MGFLPGREVNEGVKVSEIELSSKREGESLEQEIANKQKMEEETKELKKHLQIVTDNDDDVYTDAIPLASKIPIIDYKIHEGYVISTNTQEMDGENQPKSKKK